MGTRYYGLKKNLSYSTTLVKPTPQSKVTKRSKVTEANPNYTQLDYFEEKKKKKTSFCNI